MSTRNFRRSWPVRCCFMAMLFLGMLGRRDHTASSKEVEVTSEWTLLGENDTIPKGVHVRMDMTTGEKWVKLVEDDEEEEQRSVSTHVEVDGSGNVVSAVPLQRDTNEKEGPEAQETVYDYDTMHRTLSQVPPDEQERMGGLPELPSAGGKTNPEQREAFEARMKEIWERRQEELLSLQEELMADLPGVLMDRIQRLQSYLGDPYSHLMQLDLEADNDIEGETVTDIVSVLKDLEYHLSDIDMARDFCTLGGWPLVVSLLSDSVHNSNHTLNDEFRAKMHVIQAHAAWLIGTMVKNTEEFHRFAVEEIPLGGQSVIPLSILADIIGNVESNNASVQMKKQKAMYALGALLRGNRLAQAHFVKLDGPSRLSQALERACDGISTDDKVTKRILALADDIVSDVLLHEGSDVKVDDAIISAFTTESWCESALQLIKGPQSLQEAALRTVHTIAPYCDWDQFKARETIEWLETVWRSDAGATIDPDHLQERLDLVESVLAKMEEERD